MSCQEKTILIFASFNNVYLQHRLGINWEGVQSSGLPTTRKKTRGIRFQRRRSFFGVFLRRRSVRGITYIYKKLFLLNKKRKNLNSNATRELTRNEERRRRKTMARARRKAGLIAELEETRNPTKKKDGG